MSNDARERAAAALQAWCGDCLGLVAHLQAQVEHIDALAVSRLVQLEAARLRLREAEERLLDATAGV